MNKKLLILIAFLLPTISWAMYIDSPSLIGTTLFQADHGLNSSTFIADTGNFGIGTTTPQFPLTVQGNMNFFGSSTNYTLPISLEFINASTTPGAIYDINRITINGGTTGKNKVSENLYFRGGNGTILAGGDLNIASFGGNVVFGKGITYPSKGVENITEPYMKIATGGNVGVGTGTPFAKFVVTGKTAQTNPLLFIDYSANGVSTSSALTVTSSGNVGIGTSTPGTFSSWATLTGKSLQLDNGTDGSANIMLGGNVARLDLVDYDAPANSRRTSLYNSNGFTHLYNLNDGGTAVSRLALNNTTGNIGIGTTTPASTLTVNGAIGTDGAIVTLSSCGTNPTVTLGSTATAGEISEGTVATGCTISFPTTKTNIPFCTITSLSGLVFTYSISTTAITITNVGALSSTKLNYICINNDL